MKTDVTLVFIKTPLPNEGVDTFLKVNLTFLAEVAGGHGFVEPLLDLVVDELHKGIVLGKAMVKYYHTTDICGDLL